MAARRIVENDECIYKMQLLWMFVYIFCKNLIIYYFQFYMFDFNLVFSYLNN